MKTFLGIDFGTTQTVVTMIKEGSKYEPEVVEIDGKKTVDTALRLDAGDNVLFFGQSALDRIHEAPEDTFYNFKAAIGSGKIFRSSHKEYSPETLALIFLKHLRQKIEKKYFNVADDKEDKEVSGLTKIDGLHCVIGCPVSWNEQQRQAISGLAEKAGFPSVICCDESLGFIYYYYCKNENELDRTKAQNVLVYDFGGGATNVAVGKIPSSSDVSATEKLRVQPLTGIPDLGGWNFDEKLRDHFIEDIRKTTAAFDEKDSKILEYHSKLLKEELSIEIENGKNSVERVIPMLFSTQAPYTLKLSKNDFENISGSLVERMEAPMRIVEQLSTFSETGKISSVILAGGSSRLYYVKNMMEKLFPDGKVLMSTNPLEVIGKGLAFYGRQKFLEESVAENDNATAQDGKFGGIDPSKWLNQAADALQGAFKGKKNG